MKSPPWALVLAGGAARGLAHAGVLNGLEDAGFPKPSLVVGTSIGAIIGSLYACGMSPKELKHFVIEEFDVTDYLDSFVFKLDGPVGRVIQTGQALASLAGKPGVDSGKRVFELVKKLTAGKTFEETDIPFRCNAVDLYTGREVVFKSGSVARAVRASMSLPVFFEPLFYRGMCLVDGGLSDNIPVSIARNEGFDRVIAVNVNRFVTLKEKDLKNGQQIIYRSIESMFHTMSETKAQADVTLDATDDSSLVSFMRQRQLVRLGEKTVTKNMAALEEFFNPRPTLIKRSKQIIRKINE